MQWRGVREGQKQMVVENERGLACPRLEEELRRMVVGTRRGYVQQYSGLGGQEHCR